MDDSESQFPLALVAGTGAATLALATGLAIAIFKRGSSGSNQASATVDVEEVAEVLDPEVYPGGHLTVYYGSQTGTAEQFANEIEREGESHGFKIEVVDLEDAGDNCVDQLLQDSKRDSSGKSRAIFLMATYGEGEPTDNAASFINSLRVKAGLPSLLFDQYTKGTTNEDSEEKKGDEFMGDMNDEDVDPTWMEGLEFAVFGLGNKQYEHYNAMGKFVNDALGKVGANRIATMGMGDDDADLEADFESWKDSKLWPSLKKRFISSEAAGKQKKSVAPKLPDCPFVLEYLETNGKAVKPDVIPLDEVHNSTKHYFTAVDCPVTLSRELRSPQDGGSTVHIEVDISKADKSKLSYQTADNLGVLPVNEDSVVEAVANALGYDLNAVFRIQSAPGHDRQGALFPTPCTVRDCLARYCDLTSPPRRSELKLLASYAKDPLDQKALLRMASKEGKAEYKEKITGAQIGLVDIVSRLCKSIEAPLEHFITLAPRLQTRFYTISSSSSVHPNSIHATVSVLGNKRKDGSVFKGVCSNHLAGIAKNGMVRVFCRDSTFRLPSDPSRPIIMVGPGTGIAPMRALLQERSHQRFKRKLPVGESILYFGCKNREFDFLYKDELEHFQEEGTLTKLILAFSREQSKKVYVQHLIAQHANDTWKLLDAEKASVYVCGGVKMGHDVTEALKTVIMTNSNKSADEAKHYLDQMHSEGRFVQELWA